MENKSSPFIIWTFRRSGGTNLGQSLFELSEYKAVQHEPFNSDRVFSHVIKDWNENKDEEKLYHFIDEILKRKLLIKHCLEIMPEELNLALAKISNKYGYKHLFLYRENPKSRLLSLNYSLKTNVWGKEHIQSRPFDEKIFDTNINIEYLIKHEKECRRKMSIVYDYFLSCKSNPLSVSFEMLYKSNFEYSSLIVRDIFKELNSYSYKKVSDSLIESLLRGGSQGTNNDYLRFPNSQEFIKEIEKMNNMNLYVLDNNIEVEFPAGEDILYLESWDILPSIYHSSFHINGVIVSKGRVESLLDDEGKDIVYKSDIRSDRMGNRFNGEWNSRNCQFLTLSTNTKKISNIKLGKSL